MGEESYTAWELRNLWSTDLSGFYGVLISVISCVLMMRKYVVYNVFGRCPECAIYSFT